jgi:NAD(P)-dependent dehydrogenase (short-subunit alcohol dehydrogenase family)
VKPTDARVVLVTGISSGLGRALAARLVAAGDRVFGTVRSDAVEPPAGVTAVHADVDDEQSVIACVSRVLGAAGRIDVLVNNAGRGLAGPLEETTVAEARAIVETNLLGVHRMCRAVLPGMRERRRGHVVNVGSLAGRVGLPFQGLYSATKFALAGYSESLRLEAAPWGVRVSLVEPGDLSTAFSRNRRIVQLRAGSPYQDRFARALAATVASEARSVDLEPFLRTVQAVLDGSSGRHRFASGRSAERAYVALLPAMPQPIAERLLLTACGLGE